MRAFSLSAVRVRGADGCVYFVRQARRVRSWARASAARPRSSPTAASPGRRAASSSVRPTPLPLTSTQLTARTGHVVPEAINGGPIALVEDGDEIVIDAASREINWLVGDEEQARRRTAWEASGKNELREKRGILYKYARDVAVRVALVGAVVGCADEMVCSRRTSVLTLTKVGPEILETGECGRGIGINESVSISDLRRRTTKTTCIQDKYNLLYHLRH